MRKQRVEIIAEVLRNLLEVQFQLRRQTRRDATLNDLLVNVGEFQEIPRATVHFDQHSFPLFVTVLQQPKRQFDAGLAHHAEHRKIDLVHVAIAQLFNCALHYID